MKYFVYEEDGCFETILTLDELKKWSKVGYDKVMSLLFNVKLKSKTTWDLGNEYQYDNLYSLETNLSIEQLKKVVDHDFIYQELELLKCLGKLEKLI